jgi:hypothetical protein
MFCARDPFCRLITFVDERTVFTGEDGDGTGGWAVRAEKAHRL